MADEELSLKLTADNLDYKRAFAELRVQTARDLGAVKTTVATALSQARVAAAQNFAGIKQAAVTNLGQARVTVAGQLAQIKTNTAQTLSQIKTQTARDLSEIRQNARRTLSSIGSDISSFGGQVKSAGAALTVGVTAPLAALAAVSTRSALQLDTFRNRLLAVEGTAEAAERRITSLRGLAQDSVGVTTRTALDAYSQFKVIGDITENTIERQIKAFGRLNAAFTIDDPQLFNRNLTQIFTQSFEIKDIREALGRIPIFNQLLESAFGTSDPEKLRQLKAAGRLTLDSFLAGIAGAVEASPTLSQIQESLSVRLEKTFERIQFALAPIGESILRTIEPFIEPTARLIERIGAAFASLPDSAKLAILALGAIAAIAGPAIVALGALVAAVGAVVTAVGAVGAPVVAGVTGVIAVIVAASAALVVAWQTNFGGIQEITTRVLSELSSFAREVVGTLIQWWQQNLPLLRQSLETVLNGMRQFWATHGQQITAIVTTAWQNIKTVVTVALNGVLSFIRIVLQVINNDWRGAWDTYQAALAVALRGVAVLLARLPGIVQSVMRTVLGVVISAAAEIHARALEAGFQIGQAIVLSILRGIASINPQAAIAGALVVAITGAGAQATQAAASVGNQAGQAYYNSFNSWLQGLGQPNSDLTGGVGEFVTKPAPAPTATGAGKAGGGKAKAGKDPQAQVVDELRQEVARLTVETSTYNKTAVEQEIAQLRLRLGINKLKGNYRDLAEVLLAAVKVHKDHLVALGEIKKAEEEAKEAAKKLAEERADAADKVRAAINEQIVALVGQETQLERVSRVIKEADVLGAIDARTAAWLRQLAVLNDIESQVNNVAPPSIESASIPQAPGQEGGPRVNDEDLQKMGAPPATPWMTFSDVVTDVSRRVGEAVGVTGQTVQNVFNGIAAAVSQTVQAFGGLGGAVQNMSAFVKAVLRSVAQMAAVQAVFEAAQALAMWAASFFWPALAAKAALHAKSAALYAAVAGVAGAASAVVGSGGVGGAGAMADGGGGGGGGNTTSGGTTERDRTIREPRTGGSPDPNQPQLFGHVAVDLKYPDGHVEQQMVRIYERNGALRSRLRGDLLGEAQGG